MRKLLCYTRKPIDEFYYDPRLAYSMHLALEINGKVQALNHNSGVLFPLATENANGSLNPKCLRHPYIFNMNNDTFGEIYFDIEEKDLKLNRTFSQTPFVPKNEKDIKVRCEEILHLQSTQRVYRQQLYRL